MRTYKYLSIIILLIGKGKFAAFISKEVEVGYDRGRIHYHIQKKISKIATSQKSRVIAGM